jgi:phosphatidylserine decarboxylase
MSEQIEEVLYYERGSPELKKESIWAVNLIKWAYQSPRAGLFRYMMYKSKLMTWFFGAYAASRLSKKDIRKSIRFLGIDENEFELNTDEYRNFNQFFIRKLKNECRPYSDDLNDFISPADGRVLVFPELEKDLLIPVKGCKFSVDHLLNKDAPEFHNGALAVIRLCPADYHRFHFPFDAKVIEVNDINGAYHSVNPIVVAIGQNIFCENKRAYTILENEQFGKVVFMEVGAFAVACITNSYTGNMVKRMQEKGYFEFGGSTVIMIFEKDKIEFSEDLIKNSTKGFETLVKVGQTIGTMKESMQCPE